MDLASPQDHYFVSSGLKLHYVAWGNPEHPVLILVHGGLDQCRSWDFFVAALFDQNLVDYYVIAMDLRGHGDSDWSLPNQGYQHQDYLLDISRLLHHLGRENVTLMGHSLGGSMVMLFTGCFPAKVEKLILVEGVGPFARSEGEIPDYLARWIEQDLQLQERTIYRTKEQAVRALQTRYPRIPDGAAFHMVRYGTTSSNEGFVWKYDPRLRFRSYATFSEDQVRAFVERISCPTLLLYGGEGDLVNSPRASRIPLFEQKGRVFSVPGSRHHIPHEKPEALAQAVATFLRES